MTTTSRLRIVLAAAALAISVTPAFAGYDEGLTAYQRRDWANAQKEFRPLAEQGNAAAQARLGHMLFEGLGGPRDDVQALKLLNAAAIAGDPIAQHWLASAYFLGRAVPKDVGLALVWFGRAADKDQPESIHALAEIHFNGIGVNRDESKGIEFFTRAANLGWAASRERLAQFNWDGRAMPTDKAKALDFARQASGRPIAQFILGLGTLTGEGGTAKDPPQAAQWFRKAADQGHPQSQHNLGAMLVNGMGVPKSLNEGYFWLALGAERAPANLKQSYEKERDAVGAKLPQPEIDAARQRIAMWKPVGGGPQIAQAPAVAAAQPNAPRSLQPAPAGKISSGSGFVVSADGIVLTNAHVVEQCRTISVKTQDGPALISSLLAKDSANDMALLRTSLRLAEVARFREAAPLRSGDAVVVVGYPLSSLLSREANVTAGVISAMAGLHGDPRHYQITAPVQKGNSGGPLTDMSGNVVGIVSSKLNAMKIAGQTGDLPQNINFAIKADMARKFLGDNSVPYQTNGAATQLSVADVGERIKRVTVFVQCQMD
ncbi:MAG: SEL1-like repeat protein [Magnetospirillum sp.]|nr:SEL1-like repeat protein [Magnetospirillum sp.]